MKFVVVTFFCLRLLLQESCYGVSFDNSLFGQATLGIDEKAKLSCVCGKLKKVVTKPIPWKLAEDIFRNTEFFSANATDDINYIMKINPHFKNCSLCQLKYSKCPEDPESLSGYSCTENTIVFHVPQMKSSSKEIKVVRKRSVEQAINIEIPIGGLPEHHRYKRQNHICAYPTSLTTAELRCKIYPCSVTCKQCCAKGHTLPTGNEIERTCTKDTNRWEPCNFEECKPCVDCGVTLVCGGAFTCSTPTVTENVCCRIRCDRFEDKEACEEREYTCDDRGNWSPPLPFCVVPGSGLELLSNPK